MRKVEIHEYDNMCNEDRKEEKTPITTGWFHCFGLDAGYHEGQSASWTIAVVERMDGSVVKVNLDCIRFLDNPE